MSDAGGFLRRRARAGRRAFIWRARWLFVLLLFFGAALTAIGWAIARVWYPWATSAWIGGGIVGIAWTVVEMLRLDGHENSRLGARWELETARELKRYASPGSVSVHDIPLENRNIDHAVVGPWGVAAFETKSTRGRWRVLETGIEELKLNDRFAEVSGLLDSARRRAHDLRMLLMAVPARLKTHPIPVLVLWGRIEKIPGGARMIDGVLVGTGAQAAEWLPTLVGTPLSEADVAAAVEALELRKRQHRDRTRVVA